MNTVRVSSLVLDAHSESLSFEDIKLSRIRWLGHAVRTRTPVCHTVPYFPFLPQSGK